MCPPINFSGGTPLAIIAIVILWGMILFTKQGWESRNKK